VRSQTTTPLVHFGVTTQTFEGVVDAEHAIAFATATFDAAPAYLDGREIPPLYSAVLLLPAMNDNLRTGIDPSVITGQAGGLHGVHAEHDVYFHGPLHPDQRVQWESSILSLHQTSAGVLCTQQIFVRDLNGTPLIEHRWSTMAIKCTTTVTGGPSPADHRYPNEARGHVIGAETFYIPRNQGEIYRDASGDNAGHAMSDEIARAEGYPSKILQGMCTFATSTGAAVRIGGGGDATRLRRIAGRFTRPVVQGLDLTVECAEVETRLDGTYVVAFEARQGETVCITHGRAEFHDPS